MRELIIGNKVARVPIIQGGMGVGVSSGKLAGAVAKAGAVGIISSAQIGYLEEDFVTNHKEANNRALRANIKYAKGQSKGGLVGVNVMHALKDYEEHVRVSVEAGADVVICGAGLPMNLPELVAGSDTKFAPIVSSAKAASILLRRWAKTYDTTADFIVIEGPMAGGHLGFDPDRVEHYRHNISEYDEEIAAIIETVKPFEEQFKRHIPVIVAGGIFDYNDIMHAIGLGADGVQMASRFVATNECDASEAYKEAYIKAKTEDIRIIKSPVGMPGRAINNKFLEEIGTNKSPIRCLGCLAKCNPAQIPYCITDALIRAVKGDVDNGLMFAGENVGRIDKIVSVQELIDELMTGAI